MTTRKVKTMAEMAADYGVSKESFKKQIEKSRWFDKKSYKYSNFDGDNFYPVHMDKVYSFLGKPFDDTPVPLSEKDQEPAGINVRLIIADDTFEDLIKQFNTEATENKKPHFNNQI